MTLQLAFAEEIWFKDCNDEGFRKIKLVKICLRALIIDMFYTEAWNRVLILAASISILTISILLIRTCFPISPYKVVSFKLKFRIAPVYDI